MESNKTKEEILKETILKDGYTEYGYDRHFKTCESTIIKAMQEYADQQTEQLKKENEKLKKDIELGWNALIEVNADNGMLLDKTKQLQSQLLEKDKELSELKAKHKEDIIKAFDAGIEEGNQTNNVDFDLTMYNKAEQYYTQTHGQ